MTRWKIAVTYSPGESTALSMTEAGWGMYTLIRVYFIRSGGSLIDTKLGR
jgi:hypothetical protein